jgi:predicted secreted protein
MGIAGSLMVIAIAWWLAFFMLLPIGVRSQLEDGSVARGTEPSAPTSPRLAYKAIGALVIAIIVWAVLFAVVELEAISLDAFALPDGLRWS